MTRRAGRLLKIATMIVMSLLAADARAADAANGMLLAASHCAVCHSVAPPQRNELADAPSFEAIARKHDFNAAVLALVILGPHPKMNFMPRRSDAEDIAAYIATLSR